MKNILSTQNWVKPNSELIIREDPIVFIILQPRKRAMSSKTIAELSLFSL